MKKYLFTLLLFWATGFVFAQLTPEEAVAGMARGINLGNTLEPPTEGAWNNGPAQESYFDAYLEAGFTNVRVPVRWDQHTGNTAPFTINESWLDRVEEVIDWGLSRGFYITLNGHHEDWLKNDYSNTTLQARYDAIWTQVANRFKDKSDKLLFEIINEPNGMTVEEVDDLNARILGIIRQSNPTRIVIYSGNMYANSEQLLQAAIPDDDYLIGYYHAYDPWPFSGQGNGTWGTPNDYQQMNNKYQSVKTWSVINGIPVHHSEFGALRVCDYNSRMRIYAHNVEQCLANGFAFSVWDDGGDFGILNRSDNSWPEVKDILVHYHEDSPHEIFSSLVRDPVTNAPSVVLEWKNRAINNGDIILERSIGATTGFEEIATLAPDATTYTDTNVMEGIIYNYRMYTTRSDGTLLHGYPTRTTVVGTDQAPFTGVREIIPGIIEMEEYDLGGEGLAYHDTEPENIPAGYRVDEGVDIGALGNGYILEYVANGEWIEYSINVTHSGTYRVDALVATQIANGTFSVSFEKNNATTSFTVPGTGDWYTFQSISAANTIDLEAGEQKMRLSITNTNPFNVDYLTFSLLDATNTEDLGFNEYQINVFPNPTQDLLEVNFIDFPQDENIQLNLLNIDGKFIQPIERIVDSNITIDLSTLPRGTYLLQFVGKKGSSLKQITLQ